MRRIPAWLALLVFGTSVLAQQSTSYQISDSTFGGGGTHLLTSTNYRVSFVSVGAPAMGDEMSSTFYRMNGSFAACYPPPGEVRGLAFTDQDTMVWEAEGSIGDYNLYRERLTNLAGLGYGTCLQWDLADETATDGEPVPAGDGFFYLVTADNRLGEEGTKGLASDGTERANQSACP